MCNCSDIFDFRCLSSDLQPLQPLFYDPLEAGFNSSSLFYTHFVCAKAQNVCKPPNWMKLVASLFSVLTGKEKLNVSTFLHIPDIMNETVNQQVVSAP